MSEENYEINKLDINRIYRYLEKFTNENAEDIEEKVVAEDAFSEEFETCNE